jgi:hypothetical protein
MLNLIKRALRAVGLMKPERRRCVYEFKTIEPTAEFLRALENARRALEAMKPGPPSVFRG